MSCESPKKVLTAVLAAVIFSAGALKSEDAPEVRTGLREIFGDAPAAKAKLGLVESPYLTPLDHQILDIVRFDLALVDLVELYSLTPSDAEEFGHPKLDIKTTLSSHGTLLTAKITAGREVVFSKNYTEPADARRLAHRLARDALRTLTAETAFFVSKIAFTLKHQGKKEIWITDWDGKNAQALTNWASISMLAAFSPDGKKAALTSYREGNPDLYLVDLATRQTTLLSDRQGLNASAAFDPLGDGVVATLSMGKNPNLYFLDMTGKIHDRLTRTSGVDTSASFSPNGREISFTTDRSGNPQIFIMNRDGSNPRRLTYGFFWADEPAWSPDGSVIAFSAKKSRPEYFQIYLADPLGLRFVQMTNTGANEHPAISPDSRFLAYSSKRNGKWEIFIRALNRESHELRVLSFEGADAVEPAWSALEKE
ncbi:MAG: PD40 domain-containing protein [Elusimicrobia bacterium]|nr:PD40 domain-containing protein [Elusimicrobiota bacterium]